MQSNNSSPRKAASSQWVTEQYLLKHVTKHMDGPEQQLVRTLLRARHGFIASALSPILSGKALTNLWHWLEKRNQSETTQPLANWYFISSSATRNSAKSTVMGLLEQSTDGTKALRMLLPNGTSWVDQKFMSHYLVTVSRVTSRRMVEICGVHPSPSPNKLAYCEECYLLVLTHLYKRPGCQCQSSTVTMIKYKDSRKLGLMTATLQKQQSPSAKH